MQKPPPFIAIGNYDFRPSGTVVKSIEIATAAAQAGLPVQLWVVRDEGALRSRVPANVPVVATGSRIRAQGRELDLALNIPSLAAALRRHGPRLFLSGGNHLHLAARAALVLSGRRRSILFGARASNSAQHGRASPWRSLISRMDNRLKFGGADFIVAVAHALADEIRSALPRRNVTVIANGVDITKVERLAAEPFDHPFFTDRPPGVPILVSMGRLVHQKGFDILIPALARLQDQSRLVIIGDGSADQFAALEALARDEGVAERVALVGYRANPFAILAKADLFVSASRWEGASNALIEALACGLPLVATDCPTGNREVVEAGPFGTMAPVEDVAGLAAAIGSELSMDRSTAMQRAGAHRWSLDRCMRNWTSLLEEKLAIIAERGATPTEADRRNILTAGSEDS